MKNLLSATRKWLGRIELLVTASAAILGLLIGPLLEAIVYVHHDFLVHGE